MLPKLECPTYKTQPLPISGKVVEFRPWLVKEEKLLLVAAQEGKIDSVVHAVKGILAVCTFNKVDIEKLPSLDIEYLFLQIRIKSKGNITPLVFTCQATKEDGTICNTKNNVDFDLDLVKVAHNEAHTKKLMLTDDIGLMMKYPTLDVTLDLLSLKEPSIDMIAKFVDYVIDGENVHNGTEEEVIAFIENLSPIHFEKITEFFNTMPKLEGRIKFKCKECGHSEEIIIAGLQNFFR